MMFSCIVRNQPKPPKPLNLPKPSHSRQNRPSIPKPSLRRANITLTAGHSRPHRFGAGYGKVRPIRTQPLAALAHAFRIFGLLGAACGVSPLRDFMTMTNVLVACLIILLPFVTRNSHPEFLNPHCGQAMPCRLGLLISKAMRPWVPSGSWSC